MASEEDDEKRNDRISRHDSEVSSQLFGGTKEESSDEDEESPQRPRFGSDASWADSTRFDRADSRASDLSSKDLRLSNLDSKPSRRSRSDSRSSRYSRASSRASRTDSFLSKGGKKAGLSTITENWDAPIDQFASPFADIDAQEQPIQEQLQKGLELINDHATKLKDIEDAISASMSEVWGYWADPIQLHLHPAEKVDVQDLIRTDNELFNKVLTVFAVLCDEISELKVTAEANFYPALIMFGQAKHGDESEVKPGEDELQMGRMLPFFQDVSNFIDRCNSIAINLIHQLASLYHTFQKLWKSTFKLVHLRPVYDSLADLIEVLITLDAIVMDNTNISTAWDKYKRMMQYVRADPSRYSVTVERVKQFERLLVSLDQTIMSAQLLQTCIEQDFEALPIVEDEEDDDEDESNQTIDVRNNRVFLEEFFYCIKDRFEQIHSAIGTPLEAFERQKLVGTFGLYVLYRRLTPPNLLPDANFYKSLWELQLKVPCVTLCGRILWFSAEFLLKYAPFSTKKLHPEDIDQCRRENLHRLDESFAANEIASATAELQVWLVRMESFFQPTTRGAGDTSRVINIRGNLILKGLMLATRIQTQMHSILNLHLSLNIPMQKKVVRPLYQCIEILKGIEFMFARKNPIVAESIALVMNQVSQSILAFFRPIKAKLEASKKFDDTKLDVLAAVTVIEDLLKTSESFSYTRLTVLSLAIRISAAIAASDAQLATAFAEPIKLIWKLSLYSDFQRRIRRACDCSFFYWSRELLSTFVQDIYKKPEQANRIQYILAGFSDALSLLNAGLHEETNVPYVDAYGNFITQVLEDDLVTPLCQDVENDLRLHIHAVHLDHMEAPNPKTTPDFKVLHYYLDLRPLRLVGSFLDLRERVTLYLESTFYNLTTVALHDWKTYGEMRNLANDKYGLTLAENHLPMGSLDQGLDILQIMRNIHIFVARYNYNLNQQFFLERRSDKGSRHLNSINIHSIASSIRTHGMGIMNTTVNFTYQFLLKKFDIFSQFLFDEYIKSYLQKEKRWYKKHKEERDNMYDFSRAFQFNKDIRKLGVSDTGKTFLDQFRILVTEIGNALGYVRMVRSAGMNYCFNAIKFVPDLNTTEFHFEPYVGSGNEELEGADLSSESVQAARQLDGVLSNLSKNFSENNDYFKILVKVFEDVMKNEEQKHLANFYQILPALTINFVENSVQAKDQMYKNSRRKEAYFSDDGFAIGIAYFLAILNQSEDFDALHWFDQVVFKYAADEEALKSKENERQERKKEQATRKLKETTAELIDDEEEVHTLQLTAKRIEQNRREFDLLNWSVNGARIFFKD